MIFCDPYSTHLPILAATIAHTTGDVLELGAGWYSTPLISALLSANSKRRAYSFEPDANLRASLQKVLMPRHEMNAIQFVTHESELPDALEKQHAFLTTWWNTYFTKRGSNLGVVFIDHAPGLLRGAATSFFADKSEYIVIHDSEVTGEYGYESAVPTFTYAFHFKQMAPWTSVLSRSQTGNELGLEALSGRN